MTERSRAILWAVLVVILLAVGIFVCSVPSVRNREHIEEALPVEYEVGP